MNQFLTKHVVKATFDATAGSPVSTAGVGLGVFIPNGAIITNAYYNVGTTFTSSTDAATIALQANSAGDLKAAIAISASGDVYDAGVHGCLPGNFALDGNALTAIAMAAARSASYIVMTANRELKAVVAVEALTAGTLDLFVEYYL